MAEERLGLTDRQLVALEKKKERDPVARGDRNRPSRLSGSLGHLLCGHFQGSGPHLSANLPRHLCEGDSREVVYNEDFTHRCGVA